MALLSRKQGMSFSTRNAVSPRGGSVCDRLMDTISETTGVICECRLVRAGLAQGNLEITAKDYTDYVLARQIALGAQFRFAPANISFVQHKAAAAA